jgi:hypothetical protein
MIIFNENETPENKLYDTINLRNEANYEIEVYKDVYWVPVNQLGKTRYTNDDIKTLLKLKPEEKRDKINTLYEAIQLYQIGNFKGVLDNQKIIAGNLCWNYHKPGFHAVRTNEGCCASNSNWLSYLLKDKYEQAGFLHYSQRDGGGHIMSYIFHNGWYYFIDMMMYRTDQLEYSGKETGTIEGYRDNELIAGNFFKSRMPISYVNFCLNKHRDAPVLFIIIVENEVYAMAADGVPGCYNVIHPNNTKTVLLYTEKDFNFLFDKPLDFDYDWNVIPTDEIDEFK